MKKLLLIAAFAGVSTLFGAVDLGISIGAPPAPRVVRVRPVAPGPDYSWIDGYWYVDAGHYRWHAGYWSRPPYVGATWVGPRYEGGHYYNGYWNGDHGRVEHNHAWDRDHDRDYNRH